MTITKLKRELKGNSLLELPNDYTIIDIETTGLDPNYDDILEVSAIKVRNNKIEKQYNSLINSAEYIPEFITELTGINIDMLKNAPNIDIVLNELYNFIENDVLVGHNVNFDINFLYDNIEKILDKKLSNDFVDTLRLSRRLNKELNHHRMGDLLNLYKIDTSKQHRALNDCEYTFTIYNNLKNKVLNEYGNFNNFEKIYKNNHKISNITATTDKINEDNYFYGKYVVFTGTLSMSRNEAAQIIVNLGGFVSDSITKNTNYLILGIQDYSKIKGEKSSKQIKAEECILKGQDLTILTENVFYDIINDIN